MIPYGRLNGQLPITPGWLPVMSLHGSTAVTIDGRGFSSASPRPAFCPFSIIRE